MPLTATIFSAMFVLAFFCFGSIKTASSLSAAAAPAEGRCAASMRSGREALVDIVGHQRLKVVRDRLSPQRQRLFAVDEYRCGGRFARTGQADADIGVFAFARAIDDAAHDGDF